MGIDLIKTYGVDGRIGLIVSTIIGATETTIYTIAVYTSVIKVKRYRGILIAGLMVDIVGILVANIICSNII